MKCCDVSTEDTLASMGTGCDGGALTRDDSLCCGGAAVDCPDTFNCVDAPQCSTDDLPADAHATLDPPVVVPNTIYGHNHAQT